MSGFFGSISSSDSVNDVYYGTDYNSHLGTRRAGMVFYNAKEGAFAIASETCAFLKTGFEIDYYPGPGRSY